jgi:hypothetical protein
MFLVAVQELALLLDCAEQSQSHDSTGSVPVLAETSDCGVTWGFRREYTDHARDPR